MIKKFVVSALILGFAFSVLTLSVFRSAAVKYSIKQVSPNGREIIDNSQNQDLLDMQIDYYLPAAGPVLPGSFWWPLKAARDRLWLFSITDQMRKAQLTLLFADKRLAASKILFDEGQYQLGVDTLSKAEKYLETACDMEDTMASEGIDTLDFATTLIKASIKHRQIIKQILLIVPEESKSAIVLSENYARGVYGRKVHVLIDRGVTPIADPFFGQ